MSAHTAFRVVAFASSAEISSPSCCTAGWTLLAPEATRFTRTASTSTCSAAAASSVSKPSGPSGGGPQGTVAPSTRRSAGGALPEQSSACSPPSKRRSKDGSPASPRARVKRAPLGAPTRTRLPRKEARPACICFKTSPMSCGVAAK